MEEKVIGSFKSLAPIALFVYNRPDHTRRTLQALISNDGAADSDLFVFSDAAKDERSVDKVTEVRNLIKQISGFRSIHITEKQLNYGLSKSIITGVTEIVNTYGKVIVLEDDVLTSPCFLSYMNSALDFFQHKEEVISIHGYIYPVKNELPPFFFLKGADCWGWATWKRGWDLFEPDAHILLSKLKAENKTFDFDFSGSAGYTKMLQDQIKGKVDSWAIRWYASAYLENKLTLYPGKTFVRNIGLDNSGTHTKRTDLYDSDLNLTFSYDWNKMIIKEDPLAKANIKLYFERNSRNNLLRLASKIWKRIKH